MRTSSSILAVAKTDATDLTTFLQQNGYLNKEASGIYHLSTLGSLALSRLEELVHHEMEESECVQWQMSLLQHQENWDKTGRSNDYGDELMSVRLRSGQVMRLAATAEEQITNAVCNHLNHRHVNHWFYQINTKWRDELRARAGLLRAREFRMLDAYSFDETEEAMMKHYEKGKQTLLNVLEKLGCVTRVVASDCGEIGGLMSEEIQVQTSLDETGWLEVGHCFALGQKYSKAFSFVSAQNNFVWMSCHGLGTTRLLAVLLNARHKGMQLLGDSAFSVVDDVVVCIGTKEETLQNANLVYNKLKKAGRKVLWEDRYKRAGQLLAVSEMLGAANRWIISDRMEEGMVEHTVFGGETQLKSIANI